jgi:HAD superfamily hydrolase (TIGR01509 family)
MPYSPLPPRLQAVLFDLGDTLWYYRKPVDESSVAEAAVRRVRPLLERWRLPLEADILCQRLMERAAHATAAALQSDLRSPNYPAIAQEVALALGTQLSDPVASELWEAFAVPAREFDPALFSDALPTLESLRSRGLRIGCVTNRWSAGRALQEELDALGLTEFFDTLAVSCEVGYLKPHPAIFEHALRELGVPARAAAMVGDAPAIDVAGARAVGMIAVWKRRTEHQELPAVPPDFTIRHLHEVLTLPAVPHVPVPAPRDGRDGLASPEMGTK